MPDPKVLRQKTPGPTCVSVNVFTGRVIALATNADEATAKLAAQTAAQDARRPLVRADRALACPGNCRLAAPSTAERLYGAALSSVLADADTPEYAAYHWCGWRASVDCRSQPQYADLATTVQFEVLEHVPATVCPGTRTLSGCVLAMAIESTQALADRKAREKAKEIADDKITDQRKTQCPGGCVPQLGGDQASTPVKLEPNEEIPQARAGGAANGAKRFVSYYAASWQVNVRCVQPGGAGGGDDGGEGEGEGEMYEPRGRGNRRRN